MCTPRGCCHPLHTQALLRALTLLFRTWSLVSAANLTCHSALGTQSGRLTRDRDTGRAGWAIRAAGAGCWGQWWSACTATSGAGGCFSSCARCPAPPRPAASPRAPAPALRAAGGSGSSPCPRSSPGVSTVGVPGTMAATSSWVLPARPRAHPPHTCCAVPLSFSHSPLPSPSTR